MDTTTLLLATIFPILLFLIVGVLLYIVLKSRPKMKNTSSKRPYYLLGAYLVIISIFLFFYISIDKQSDYNIVTNSDIRDVNNELNRQLENGDVTNIHSERLISEWNVEFPYESMMISSSTIVGSLDAQIFIERLENDDDVIEVQYYRGISAIRGIDITSQISPIYVSFNENIMRVEMPVSSSRIELSALGHLLSVQQFSKGEDTNFVSYWDQSSEFPPHLIYMKIPKHIKVESNVVSILNYVN